MKFRSKANLLDSRIITDFNRTLLLVADPESLQASVAARLHELFHPERLLILVLESQHYCFVPSFSAGFSVGDLANVRFDRRGPLARWLVVNEAPLLVEEQQDVLDCLSGEEQRTLQQLRVSVCARSSFSIG